MDDDILEPTPKITAADRKIDFNHYDILELNVPRKEQRLYGKQFRVHPQRRLERTKRRRVTQLRVSQGPYCQNNDLDDDYAACGLHFGKKPWAGYRSSETEIVSVFIPVEAMDQIAAAWLAHREKTRVPDA